MTHRAALIQAENKNKFTHSSISDNKVVETPNRKMAPITRSAVAKQAKEKKKSTHNSATNKKIRVTPKGTTAPITRSVVARLAQQKEGNKSTKCRSTPDREKVLETPIIRSTYRRYGSRSRVDNKAAAHNTKTKTTKKNKKSFHCIFCNEKAFHTTEPHPSRAVGFLDCMSCGAVFKFRVTANLACGRDVQAALSGGGDIRWLSAKQGIVCG